MTVTDTDTSYLMLPENIAFMWNKDPCTLEPWLDDQGRVESYNVVGLPIHGKEWIFIPMGPAIEVEFMDRTGGIVGLMLDDLGTGDFPVLDTTGLPAWVMPDVAKSCYRAILASGLAYRS